MYTIQWVYIGTRICIVPVRYKHFTHVRLTDDKYVNHKLSQLSEQARFIYLNFANSQDRKLFIMYFPDDKPSLLTRALHCLCFSSSGRVIVCKTTNFTVTLIIFFKVAPWIIESVVKGTKVLNSCRFFV